MRPRCLALVLLAFIALGTVATAQGRRGAPPPGRRGGGAANRGNIARIETRSYFFEDTREHLEYSLFVSTRVDKKKKAPLMVFLHGLGTPAGVMLRFLVDGAEKEGYIVVAPTGYNLRGWYGVAGPTPPPTNPPNLAELSEKDVMNVLAIVRHEFTVDDRRIYLVGQSMGGAGVIHLGLKYPQIWAALAASAPALRPYQQPSMLEQMAAMPIILIHGDADPAIPVAQSREWAAKMKELKMTHEYFEVRGGGHSDGIPMGAERIFKFFDKHAKPTA
jgi:predicted peptidase